MNTQPVTLRARHIFGSIVVGLVLAGSIAHAATFEWNNANTGDFDDANNWSGTGTPPPDGGDTAQFNGTGSVVVFNADEASEVLDFNAGTVTFQSNGTDRTYALITGGRDASSTGGMLTLGVANDPLNMTMATI